MFSRKASNTQVVGSDEDILGLKVSADLALTKCFFFFCEYSHRPFSDFCVLPSDGCLYFQPSRTGLLLLLLLLHLLPFRLGSISSREEWSSSVWKTSRGAHPLQKPDLVNCEDPVCIYPTSSRSASAMAGTMFCQHSLEWKTFIQSSQVLQIWGSWRFSALDMTHSSLNMQVTVTEDMIGSLRSFLSVLTLNLL